VWVDVEVHGPALDARAACEALVAQVERDAHAARAVDDAAARSTDLDGGVAPLDARVERPCSGKALPVAVVDAPARLIDRNELDALDLAIVARSADCPPVQSGLLRAIVLRQGAYQSMKQCESARALLSEARAAANERARTQAAAWLERAIAQAEQRAAARCGGAGQRAALDSVTDAGAGAERDASAANVAAADAAADGPALREEGPPPTLECDQERRVHALLLARRVGLAASPAPRDGGADPSASEQAEAVGSAPFCRPGVTRGAP
jgi:hypothetical protein